MMGQNLVDGDRLINIFPGRGGVSVVNVNFDYRDDTSDGHILSTTSSVRMSQ